MPTRRTIVDVQGHRLSLSNLEKVFYPEAGFTKRDVLDYYTRIGPAILPHLADRPLTLKRYPNGVAEMHFYEKNCPRSRPEWVETARIWSEGNHRWMDYCMAQNLPSLIWAANLASIELHTSLSKAAAMNEPSFLVFDLDPGPPATIVECCQVGLWIRDVLAGLGLQSFAKTSGSKGLQVYAPLNSRATYDESKPFAHELARTLERQHPELVVSDMKKSLRGAKVLVDWSQNDVHKTTVCVYSLRARPQPTVSGRCRGLDLHRPAGARTRGAARRPLRTGAHLATAFADGGAAGARSGCQELRRQSCTAQAGPGAHRVRRAARSAEPPDRLGSRFGLRDVAPARISMYRYNVRRTSNLCRRALWPAISRRRGSCKIGRKPWPWEALERAPHCCSQDAEAWAWPRWPVPQRCWPASIRSTSKPSGTMLPTTSIAPARSSPRLAG
jgi:bifunctional non-homologous end joining protein LigD